MLTVNVTAKEQPGHVIDLLRIEMRVNVTTFAEMTESQRATLGKELALAVQHECKRRLES
jgi:hypothetical protein